VPAEIFEATLRLTNRKQVTNFAAFFSHWLTFSMQQPILDSLGSCAQSWKVCQSTYKLRN